MLQVAEGDEATAQVLQRHVARSFGTDAVDLLLRYQASTWPFVHIRPAYHLRTFYYAPSVVPRKLLSCSSPRPSDERCCSHALHVAISPQGFNC